MNAAKIKCRDLMVGDWIADNHGFQWQIIGVGEDYAYATFEGNEGDPWEFNDKDDGPEGIPITPEILEKNKFLPSFEMGHETLCLVSSEYSVYYRPVDTYLYVFKRDNEHGEGDFIVSDHRNKNAKYVHELQHALRLCGLNELADNFKI